jgi:hypothetical protein
LRAARRFEVAVTTVKRAVVQQGETGSLERKPIAGRPRAISWEQEAALRALADSPVGPAVWMLNHDAASEALIARVFAGQSEGLTRDDVLDNITLYWLTTTAVSSARLYWESKLAFSLRKGSRFRRP